MNSIFRPSSTKCIHINGHPYVLHDFVLKKMSIFNALLFDEQFDQKDIRIELPDYTNNPQYSKAELDNYDEQIIDDIFAMCYDSIDLTMKRNLVSNINILQLMMYFGLDNDIIKQSVRILASKKDILNKMITMPYHECFNMIMDNYCGDISVNGVMEYVKKIQEIKFPESFRVKFIGKIISKSFYISSISFKNGNIGFSFEVFINDPDSEDSNCDYSEDPKIIYESYNILCKTVVLDRDNAKFRKLIINDKEVEIIKNNVEIVPGSNTKTKKIHKFSNVFVPTISNHIAKILLGLETI